MAKAIGKLLVATALIGGATAVYFGMQKKKDDDDKEKAAAAPAVPAEASEGDEGETETVIEETTTIEEEETAPTVQYNSTTNTSEPLPEQTTREKRPKVDAESGVDTQAAGGSEIKFKAKTKAADGAIRFETADLIKYKNSFEKPDTKKDTAGDLNRVFEHKDLVIRTFVPRIGLAEDLNDMGSDYQPLGTIVNEGLMKTRLENIALIRRCINMTDSNKTLDQKITDNLRERLAIICRRVVEGAHAYWVWRADVIRRDNNKFSVYKLDAKGKKIPDGKGSFVQKTGEELKAVQARVKGLYQLTDLDKQRLAANTLWAIHQLWDNKFGDTDTLDKCIDFVISHNDVTDIPKGSAEVQVRCSDRYFRVMVDAFYAGCFNCEVPRAEMVYWVKPETKKGFDKKLGKRANLAILAGAIFHSFGLETRKVR